MIKTRLKQLVLLFGDALFLVIALYLTITVRYLQIPQDEVFSVNAQIFSFIFIIWVLVFYISNLYDFRELSLNNKFLSRFLRSTAISFALAIIFLYIMPDTGIAPKTNLVIFTIIFSCLFLGWRYLALKIFKKQLPKINIGIVGNDKKVEELVAEIKNNPHLGYELKFVLASDNEENLEELIARDKINILILENNPSNNPGLQKKLFNCLPLKITYTTLPNFYESITGRVPLEIINENWFLENLNLHQKDSYEFFKRLADFTCAVIFLIISSPIYLLVALAIKLDSRGPIIFRQLRLGQNHNPFTILKFRTMTVSNNDHAFTVDGDKRITRVGKFLRKTRLDEIPQLINIIKGEMSFIGPRPERPEFIVNLEKDIPFYAIRSLAKPGISGWDQVSGEYHSASTEDTFKKLQHDIYYIKNRSISLDLIILAKTVKTVLSYKGR
ncbi:MAG: sugar transferase [Candidatus Falkowbacteria bacterium]